MAVRANVPRSEKERTTEQIQKRKRGWHRYERNQEATNEAPGIATTGAIVTRNQKLVVTKGITTRSNGPWAALGLRK